MFKDAKVETVFFARQRWRDEEDTLRELLSYEVRSPLSFAGFPKDDHGRLMFVSLAFPSMHWSRQYEYPWALWHGDVRADNRVLDVGAGTSVLPLALAKRCRRVTTVDTDTGHARDMVDLARTCAVPTADAVNGDVRKLPFADASFDRVFCLSVLEHMRHGHADAVAEMGRVLVPGGRLLLSFDVAVEGGTGEPDFFVDEPAAFGLLGLFGIGGVSHMPYHAIHYEGVGKRVYTMMVCATAA